MTGFGEKKNGANAASHPVILVRELGKHFGSVKVFSEIDFEVQRGRTTVLWGPNGAGKTTLLQCLLGILRYEGHAEVLGLDGRRQGKEIRRQIGYIPQEIRLFADQTAWESLCFFARLRGVPVEKPGQLAKDWGMESFLDRRVEHLSGGMKQKLALVVALLSDPPILFLDEPTSNLDIYTRYEFIQHLEKLKQSGKTLFLCSHHLAEVWRLADWVIALENGTKSWEGPPENIKRHIHQSGVLYLSIAREDCQRAVNLMQAEGFHVMHNGMQLLVELPQRQKAAAVGLLAGAGIQVLDFEYEDAWQRPGAGGGN